jgi:hypothetical protein
MPLEKAKRMPVIGRDDPVEIVEKRQEIGAELHH